MLPPEMLGLASQLNASFELFDHGKLLSSLLVPALFCDFELALSPQKLVLSLVVEGHVTLEVLLILSTEGAGIIGSIPQLFGLTLQFAGLGLDIEQFSLMVLLYDDEFLSKVVDFSGE